MKFKHVSEEHGPPALPTVVSAAVYRQLKEISATALRVLDLASALGPTFEAGSIAAVAGMDREQTESALLDLEQAGLLRRESGQRFSLVQPPYADVPNAEGPAAARTSSCRRIVAAVEKRQGHEAGAHAEAIARHFASRNDDLAAEKTVEHAATGAARAAAGYDFAEAERLYSRALRATDRDYSADDARRCDLLVALGKVQCLAGKENLAEKSLREAACLAERLSDGNRLSEVAVNLPAWNWPSPGEANGLALILTERALALETSLGRDWRAMVLARLAAELGCLDGQEERAWELSTAAMELAANGAEPAVELSVRCFRDCLLRKPERVRERLENGANLVRLALKVGDYSSLFIGALAKCTSLVTLGAIIRSDMEARLMAEVASMSHAPLHEGLALAHKMARTVMEGRFAEAAPMFARCRALANEHELVRLADACWPVMMLPLREEARLAEIEAEAWDTVQRRGAAVHVALLSWIEMELERTRDAVFHFERVSVDNFLRLSSSDGSLAGLAAVAEVCIGLRKLEYAERLYGLLEPYAALNAALGVGATFGSVHYYLGRLAAGLGRTEAAAGHFEKAVEASRCIGARPWSAYAGYELAHCLASRSDAAGRKRAFALVTEVDAEAERLGMLRLLNRVKILRDQLNSNGSSRNVLEHNTSSNGTAPALTFAAENQAAHLNGVAVPNGPAKDNVEVELSSARAEPGGAAPVQSSACVWTALFCRQGEFWTVGYEGSTFFLKHRKGLALINWLLRNPGQKYHCIELANKDDLSSGAASNGGPAATESNLGPMLDATAKLAYRQRLASLRTELDEAREFNDLERIETIQLEIDALTQELARAVGLFGRDRKAGSQEERARQRVTFTIKAAVRAVSERDASLGRYLARTIRTGRLCSYFPDPDQLVKWRV